MLAGGGGGCRGGAWRKCKVGGGCRETREGWPLLKVETELSGDSTSTTESDIFLVSSLGLSCRYKIFLFCLGCSSRPSTKYFFPAVHYFNFFVPSPSKLGRPPCWAACLLFFEWVIDYERVDLLHRLWGTSTVHPLNHFVLIKARLDISFDQLSNINDFTLRQRQPYCNLLLGWNIMFSTVACMKTTEGYCRPDLYLEKKDADTVILSLPCKYVDKETWSLPFQWYRHRYTISTCILQKVQKQRNMILSQI